MDAAIETAVRSGKIEQFVADEIRNGILIRNGTRILTLDYALEDNSRTIINIVIVFAVLQCFFVALFYYSRFKFRSNHEWDIWLMGLSFLSCFAHFVICVLFVTSAGLGRHIETISPERRARFFKLTVIISFFNPAAVTLPRLCIICLYLRVFSAKPFRYASLFIAGFLIAAWIAVTSVQIRMCVPFSKQWMPQQEGTCLNQFKVYIWFGIPTILTDLMMIALPLPLIWRLQTSTNQKIGLTVTFLAGGIGIVTSIIRFTIFNKILTTWEIDYTYSGINIILWTTVEPCVYLIASTLPSLRPLLNFAIRNIHPPKLPGPLARLKPSIPFVKRVGGQSRSCKPKRAIPISLEGEGFSRVGEDHWPEHVLGTQPGLVTCCRESLVEQGGGGMKGEMELGRTALGGIVVHKEYIISTEPVAGDTGKDYVVDR